LITSTFVTPFSISSNYWGKAFADDSVPTNSTVSVPTNSTVSVPTNSTVSVPTNSTVSVPTNSTVSIPTNYTDSVPTNSTVSVPTNSTRNDMIVPNATQSWQFGSTNETRNVGDTELVQESNGTSLKLTGSGYLTQNVNSTKNLSALTLSAWIKPDYSQGSPQFTVISKESTFLLAVNNVIPPTKRAIFSVFDGIKWQTVESSSSIPEEWTHLAATFNDSSIVIYVNGKLESSLQTSGVPTLAVNGTLTTKTVDSLSSYADIIIVDYLNTLIDNTKYNFFAYIN